MTLLLPAEDPHGNGLEITSETRLDAVRHELAQATRLHDVTAVESWLYDAHRTRMRLRQVRPWINDAFALCALRRKELAAEGGEGAPGASRAFPMGEH